MAWALLILTLGGYGFGIAAWVLAREFRRISRERREEESRVRAQLYAMHMQDLQMQERLFERMIDAMQAKNLDEMHVAQIQKERARAEIEMWHTATEQELKSEKPRKSEPLARGVNRATGEEVQIDLSSGEWSPI